MNEPRNLTCTDDGIGLKVTRQLSKKRLQETKRQSTPEDEDTDESETNGAPRTFKALYPFNGTNDDEVYTWVYVRMCMLCVNSCFNLLFMHEHVQRYFYNVCCLYMYLT